MYLQALVEAFQQGGDPPSFQPGKPEKRVSSRQSARKIRRTFLVESGKTPDFVRVLHSSLHGFGVFAAIPLAPGTVVGHYQGTMTRECPDDRTFVMRVDLDDNDHFYIDARDPRTSNYTRYINDPGPFSTPNCHFMQDDLSVEVVTLRAIDADEELTARYLDWHTVLGAGSETAPDSEDAGTPSPARPKRRAASASSSRKTTVQRPQQSASPAPRPLVIDDELSSVLTRNRQLEAQLAAALERRSEEDLVPQRAAQATERPQQPQRVPAPISQQQLQAPASMPPAQSDVLEEIRASLAVIAAAVAPAAEAPVRRRLELLQVPQLHSMRSRACHAHAPTQWRIAADPVRVQSSRLSDARA